MSVTYLYSIACCYQIGLDATESLPTGSSPTVALRPFAEPPAHWYWPCKDNDEQLGLSMASQVSNICRSAYYHLSRIAKIRHSLTTSVCKSLIHGLVTSRLDYGNAMLFGIADRLLHRLEMVQRSAARVVMQIRRGDRQSLTTILQRLHCLPVNKRIGFKILVLVHKAIYEGQPVYLASLLNQHTPKRCIRSSSGLLLDVPRINLERFGRRAFACAWPTLWNNLPISLRVNGNHTQFKKLLKTYVFST